MKQSKNIWTLPTAEEFLQDIVIENNNSFDIIADAKITSDVTKGMIEFAKLHVEAALKAADNNAKMYNETVNIRNSILNAYQLTNIK